MESRSMEKSTSVRLPRLHFGAIFDSCVLCLHPCAMKVDAVQGELDWLRGEKTESPGDSCQGREVSQHCLQVSAGALGWIWGTASRVLEVSVILVICPRRVFHNKYLYEFVFVFMVSSCFLGVFGYLWVMFTAVSIWSQLSAGPLDQDIIKTFLFQDCALPEDAHPTVCLAVIVWLADLPCGSWKSWHRNRCFCSS
jgi:hypothetical protein